MASYGLPAQAKATPRPDPLLFLGGPACRSPGIRSQRASEGFFWASSGLPSLPFAKPKTLQTPKTPKRPLEWLLIGFQRPHPWLFYGRPSLPFARPKTLQTLQTLQTPKTPKTPKRPLQWLLIGFQRPHPWLFMGVQDCRLPGPKTLQTLQPLKPLKGHFNGFLWASSAGKSPHPCFFWASKLAVCQA